MPRPYDFEEGFEAGTRGNFDAETDTESRLDFPHYSALAKVPGRAMPYRGAYCMRVNLANDGSPADAYVQETGDFDTAATETVAARFALYVSNDIAMADNDEFAVYQLWSGASTVEGGIYINYTTANGLRIGVGETSASQLKALSTGVWHMVELVAVIDNAGANDGTLDAYLDGSAFTQVASLDQGAITSAVFGVMGQDAGTTTGYILIDEIVGDGARIGPIIDRFPQVIELTRSGHVFVGSGRVLNASLCSGAGTDCVAAFYDTDTAYTTDGKNNKLELKNTANNELVDPAQTPTDFHRGCYVELSGTTPAVRVQLGWANCWAEGTIRNHGLRRKAHPIMG